MGWRIAAMATTACLCLAIGGAAAAKTLVVRSAGPSAKAYPPGKTLPESATISLKPGDSVTLVGQNSTRTIRGPGTFPATSAGAAGLAMAANRRTRFGAMRTGDLALNPSPWNLDVTQSGTMCVARTGTLTLWRPDSAQAADLTISTTGGKSATIEWPAGKSKTDWPSALPVVDGAEYQVALAGSADTVRVRFATMASIPSEAVDAAQALIERGCQNQLDVLVEGLEKAE